MNIKSNLIIVTLIVAFSFMSSMWWDARAQKNYLQDYNITLESISDSLQTEIINGKEISFINAKRIKSKDEIIQELENRNFEILSQSRITVVFDTVYSVGKADTVYAEGEETVYRINESNSNYTMMGTIKTPSGSYSISIIQMPFGLEIRQITTPSGRKQTYVNIVGRDDLKISSIKFYAEDTKTKKEKKWALGGGAIISDSGVDWGVLVRRNRLSVLGTINSISAGLEIIRF